MRRCEPGSADLGRLQLCGEPAFLHADGQASAIDHKDALLLAYLALEGPTPRARLASFIWPDVDRERARASLRQRLFRLRRLLGIELLREGEVTALRDELQTDAVSAAEPDAEVSLAPLLGSFEWRGGGDAGAWLAGARERHLQAQLDRLAHQCSEHEAQGRLVAALRQAQRLIAAQPASEHAHRRVMRLHHLRGDRAAALAAYERCVQMLDDELGTAPSSETRALARQIDGQPDSPAGAAPVVPASVLRPPRLVGRGQEWAALASAWQQRVAVLVIGEAGLGKSRLVGDFAAAQPGAHVVTARPGDARAPYAFLSRLLHELLPAVRTPLAPGEVLELARLLPALGAPPAADADHGSAQARFLNAVQALLLRVCEPGSPASVTGIVIDDLHFADVASVEAVQVLMGGAAPLCWVLASRPVELPPETQALCDELLHGRAAVQLRLAPLTEAQVCELIESLAIDGLDAAPLAARLTRHTGGNPMFLLETLKAMVLQPGAVSTRGAARLPAVGGITDLIHRRIARLSNDAVRLARCAAITGQDFSSELAAEVLGVRPLDMADAWNELEAAQVFRGGAFAHDLIYEAALASVPAPIATLLHGQIAACLEARGHAPARVAQHWLDAGEAARGADALLAAAQEAARLMRVREQADLLERAAGVLQEHGDRARAFGVLLKLQEVLNALGQADRQDSVFKQLLATAASPAERHRAVIERVAALNEIGRWEEALALVNAAITESTDSAASPHLVAELRARLAAVYMTTGRRAEAEAQYRLAEPWMREHPDVPTRLVFASDRGLFLDGGGHHREARLAHQSVVDGARAHNEPALLCDALANLGLSFRSSGLLRRAAETLGEAGRLRQAYELAGGGFEWLTLGNVQRSLGEYGASMQNIEVQRQCLVGQRDLHLCLCDSSQALNYLELGQPARALQAINASAVADDYPAWLRASFLVVRARVALGLGQEQAHLLAQAGSLLGEGDIGGSVWRHVQMERSLGLAPEDALACARVVLDRAKGTEVFSAPISAHTRCAAAALRLRDYALASAHAQQALDLMAVYDADGLYRAEVGYVAWQALHAAGERSARAVLEQTVAWVQETARLHVPDLFKESFLTRNPVNRALLEAVRKPA